MTKFVLNKFVRSHVVKLISKFEEEALLKD